MVAKIFVFQFVNFDYFLVKSDYSLVIYSLLLEIVKFE